MSISYEEFIKRLEQAESLLTANVRSVLAAQALRMEADAKRNATYFPKVQTGRLRNSISGSVINFNRDEYMVLRAGGLTTPNRPFPESADVVYAAIQEFGGGFQNIKPKFYLRKARDKHLPKTEKLIGKAVSFALTGKVLQ